MAWRAGEGHLMCTPDSPEGHPIGTIWIRRTSVIALQNKWIHKEGRRVEHCDPRSRTKGPRVEFFTVTDAYLGSSFALCHQVWSATVHHLTTSLGSTGLLSTQTQNKQKDSSCFPVIGGGALNTRVIGWMGIFIPASRNTFCLGFFFDPPIQSFCEPRMRSPFFLVENNKKTTT